MVGVCHIVVLSVVEVCATYGGVNVFHVCQTLCEVNAKNGEFALPG